MDDHSLDVVVAHGRSAEQVRRELAQGGLLVLCGESGLNHLLSGVESLFLDDVELKADACLVHIECLIV